MLAPTNTPLFAPTLDELRPASFLGRLLNHVLLFHLVQAFPRDGSRVHLEHRFHQLVLSPGVRRLKPCPTEQLVEAMLKVDPAAISWKRLNKMEKEHVVQQAAEKAGRSELIQGWCEQWGVRWREHGGFVNASMGVHWREHVGFVGASVGVLLVQASVGVSWVRAWGVLWRALSSLHGSVHRMFEYHCML
jgi:hypothetical protein